MRHGFIVGLTAVLAGFGACACLSSAFAADYVPPRLAPPPAPVFNVFSELRFGASAHEISGPESGSLAITGEVLFAKPFQLANPAYDFLIPRLHLGGSLNTAGDTSFAYAGFTWTYDITQRFFVEASFGGAIHDGDTGYVVSAGRNALGCSPLFRESLGLGYRFTENWSVVANVEHMSNAGLCDNNRGLTNVGAKVGYRF